MSDVTPEEKELAETAPEGETPKAVLDTSAPVRTPEETAKAEGRIKK